MKKPKPPVNCEDDPVFMSFIEDEEEKIVHGKLQSRPLSEAIPRVRKQIKDLRKTVTALLGRAEAEPKEYEYFMAEARKARQELHQHEKRLADYLIQSKSKN